MKWKLLIAFNVATSWNKINVLFFRVGKYYLILQNLADQVESNGDFTRLYVTINIDTNIPPLFLYSKGLHCETDIDECLSFPCAYDSNCSTPQLDLYTCDCQPGFEGTNCDDIVDECLSQPCSNGGVCTDLINAFQCTCPQGTEGMFNIILNKWFSKTMSIITC